MSNVDLTIPAFLDRTGSLPAMVDRAAQTLASAHTAAEVLEARDTAALAYDAAKRAARFAKAKGAHDELISKVHRAQADALEIEAAAKRRLADEYDAAQERGEVAKAGDNQHNRAVVPNGNDLGLSRKDIHEARIIRDAEAAEPGIVKQAIEEAVSAGEEPTRSKVRRAVLRVVKPDTESQRPLRGKAAAIKQVIEALSHLSGLPNADEVAGYFRGTDAACLVDERIEPAFRWLSEFVEIWREHAGS